GTFGQVNHEPDPAEEQQREHALADRQEQVVRDERPGGAAEVARRRVGEDLVARPVGGVKTGQRQQQKQPRTAGDEEPHISQEVVAFHLDHQLWWPVWPKPPVPRSVVSRSSTSINRTGGTGSTSNWATRVPRSTVKSARPRLISGTCTSPR